MTLYTRVFGVFGVLGCSICSVCLVCSVCSVCSVPCSSNSLSILFVSVLHLQAFFIHESTLLIYDTSQKVWSAMKPFFRTNLIFVDFLCFLNNTKQIINRYFNHVHVVCLIPCKFYVQRYTLSYKSWVNCSHEVFPDHFRNKKI